MALGYVLVCVVHTFCCQDVAWVLGKSGSIKPKLLWPKTISQPNPHPQPVRYLNKLNPPLNYFSSNSK